MSDSTDRGITVTEIAAMDRPVDVTHETTTVFVGRTLRGPLNIPVLVTNYGDFRRRFGGEWSRSSLGSQARDYFDHGGNRLYVVRVANNARGALICLPASGSALVLRAVEPGSTERLRAAVDYDGIEGEERFNLTLQRIDQSSDLVIDQEQYSRVSFRADAEDFVGDLLLSSDMARLEKPLPTHRPEPTVGLAHGVGVEYVEAAQEGSDGAALSDYDLVGSREHSTGLFALDKLEQFDMLYMPPVARGFDTGPTAILAAELYCRERGAMLIADPPAEWDDVDTAISGLRELGYASPNMLSYFPRVRDARDGRGGQPHVVGGALAGLLSRLDAHHGPWRSLDQQGLGLKRKYRPVVEVDDEDQQILERSGLNVWMPDATNRLRLIGDRTLARGTEANSRESQLGVKRLCLKFINAIDHATRWSVFEKPGPRLAGRVQGQVHASLLALSSMGAIEDDVFDVQCRVEASNSGQEVQILLAFSPIGAKDPIQITLHQRASGCRVSYTAFGPAWLHARAQTPAVAMASLA